MSAFDKIMETNRKEQEEESSEKKRERVSPHKGAARPEPKKGRASPQEEATEEAHTDPDKSEHMEPMEEEEACFSEDPPEEEADKDDPTITGILKATSHIDITKTKTSRRLHKHRQKHREMARYHIGS